MFKQALKETGCQEQLSNQRGIKRFNLYFTLIQKTCLHGEVVLKWTLQLKWKKFLTVQHEKGPLVNDSKMLRDTGMPQNKYLCSTRNEPASYRNPRDLSLENSEIWGG